MDKKEKLKINFDDYITEIPQDVKERIGSVNRHNQKEVKALIPGTVVEVKIKSGQRVAKGDVLLILEAMKMRNRIYAEIDGTVNTVNVNSGERVFKGQLLITYE